MGILSMFRRAEPEAAQQVRAMAGEAGGFTGMDDPNLKEFIRSGGAGETASGLTITPRLALKNTTVLRCVSLISFSIGMLPLHLQEKSSKEMAKGHPLFRVLHRKPNPWQTSFEFRSYMQQAALGALGDGRRGSAFARIVWSGNKVLYLVPIHPDRVEVKQRADWSLEYHVRRKDGGVRILPQREIFHLRFGLSEDGVTGLSLVKEAAEAISLAMQTERAAARLFKHGMMAGLALKHPEKLSPEAHARLVESMAAREGAENAGKAIILEEGMDLASAAQSGRDAQGIEQRKHQIEETARPFGVPRPLLGVDDTSWGSGIDVLGQFFVRYGLNPWFEAWQQAIERDLLTDAEADLYEPKFNAGALLRGSMKDQAEFFAKGLGSGGHQPWLHQDEVRDWMDMPQRDDLPAPMGQQKGGSDEPSSTT